MQRAIPSGRVENGLEVFSREQPTEFGIRTTSGPTPFSCRYRFISDGANTLVHRDASVEMPGATAVLGRLAVRAVRRGVDANFAALKRALERREKGHTIPDQQREGLAPAQAQTAPRGGTEHRSGRSPWKASRPAGPRARRQTAPPPAAPRR